MYNKKKNLNFLLRIIFFLKLFILNRKKLANSIIYSRSVLCSLMFSLVGKKNYLEIHQENSGFTSRLFKFFKQRILKKTNFILISKNLNKVYSLPSDKFLIAEDGVDVRDFNFYNVKHYKEIKKSCVYTGSLYKGKGFEFILELSKKNKNFSFYVYGDVGTAQSQLLKKAKSLKNLKLMGHIPYSKIPKILQKHPVILMPYEKKVFGNHKTANLAEFMSPLKMFDYLAAKKVIISSKNENIQKILKNNYNSLICNNLRTDEWSEKIFKSMYDENFKNNLGKNAFITAKKFTWKVRANKILKFIKYNINS